jgi:hypothetical protein
MQLRRDRDGVGRRIASLCKELGIELELDDSPILRDALGAPGVVLDQLAPGPAVALTISREVADRFRSSSASPGEQNLLARLGMPFETRDLVDELAAGCAETTRPAIADATVAAARAYAQDRNPAALPALAETFRKAAVAATTIYDPRIGTTALVLAVPGNRVSLGLGALGAPVDIGCSTTTRLDIARAIDGRASVVRVGGSR